MLHIHDAVPLRSFGCNYLRGAFSCDGKYMACPVDNMSVAVYIFQPIGYGQGYVAKRYCLLAQPPNVSVLKPSPTVIASVKVVRDLSWSPKHVGKGRFLAVAFGELLCVWEVPVSVGKPTVIYSCDLNTAVENGGAVVSVQWHSSALPTLIVSRAVGGPTLFILRKCAQTTQDINSQDSICTFFEASKHPLCIGFDGESHTSLTSQSPVILKSDIHRTTTLLNQSKTTTNISSKIKLGWMHIMPEGKLCFFAKEALWCTSQDICSNISRRSTHGRQSSCGSSNGHIDTKTESVSGLPIQDIEHANAAAAVRIYPAKTNPSKMKQSVDHASLDFKRCTVTEQSIQMTSLTIAESYMAAIVLKQDDDLLTAMPMGDKTLHSIRMFTNLTTTSNVQIPQTKEDNKDNNPRRTDEPMKLKSGFSHILSGTSISDALYVAPTTCDMEMSTLMSNWHLYQQRQQKQILCTESDMVTLSALENTSSHSLLLPMKTNEKTIIKKDSAFGNEMEANRITTVPETCTEGGNYHFLLLIPNDQFNESCAKQDGKVTTKQWIADVPNVGPFTRTNRHRRNADSQPAKQYPSQSYLEAGSQPSEPSRQHIPDLLCLWLPSYLTTSENQCHSQASLLSSKRDENNVCGYACIASTTADAVVLVKIRLLWLQPNEIHKISHEKTGQYNQLEEAKLLYDPIVISLPSGSVTRGIRFVEINQEDQAAQGLYLYVLHGHKATAHSPLASVSGVSAINLALFTVNVHKKYQDANKDMEKGMKESIPVVSNIASVSANLGKSKIEVLSDILPSVVLNTETTTSVNTAPAIPPLSASSYPSLEHELLARLDAQQTTLNQLVERIQHLTDVVMSQTKTIAELQQNAKIMNHE